MKIVHYWTCASLGIWNRTHCFKTSACVKAKRAGRHLKCWVHYRMHYFTVLPTAKSLKNWQQMNEQVWIIGEMILAGENASTGRTCSSTILATKSSTWPGLRLKPGLHRETLTKHDLSHGIGIVRGLT
jgi:hypothetical protein